MLRAEVRRVSCLALASLAALALGCRGAIVVPPEPDATLGLARCAEIAEPLVVSPRAATVAAGELLVLSASGGTGAYRFRLAESPSGGAVDPSAGVYLAGGARAAEEPTVDVVVLEDRGCRGESTATLTVEPPTEIRPSRVEVEPLQSVDFGVTRAPDPEGGRYVFSLATNGTGATLEMRGSDWARYTAGGRTGRDVVRLTDTELGTTSDAIVDVIPDAALSITPTRWVIPVGTTVPLPARGGSGELTVAIEGTSVAHEGGTSLRAMADGESTVTFTDAVTGDNATVTVRAVAPHTAARRHPGDQAETHLVGGGVDLGGDGDLDLVVAMMDASAGWFTSGQVLFYENDGAGLPATPTRVISGAYRDDDFGSAIAFADLDADGLQDVLIGARRADPTRRDVGAVYLYSGVEGGLVTEAPTRAFFGANGSDLFGDAIAVCDFNDDGLLDLAISAPFGQDTGSPNDQGVVHVFLAYAGARFISAPDALLIGEVPAAGELVGVEGLRYGEALAAGDFDGDGVCDLAVHGRGLSLAQLDTGMVAIHRGRAAVYEDGAMGIPVLVDRGGVEQQPALLLGRADGMADGGRLGQGLALGDVNGDGRADLLASRSTFDGAAGSDSGALYLLFGRALAEPTTTTVTDVGTADWSFEGASGDRVGLAAQLFDVNGDGRLDVVSGDSRAEIADAELDRPGLVRVFRGGDGGPSSAPDAVYEGPSANARFGVGAAAIGDLDGDGQSEVAAFAPYYDPDETVNEDRGGLFVAGSRDGALRELGMDFPSSGQRVGEALAWVDLDGDGRPELAVGAWQADPTALGRTAGAVRIHRGTDTGASAAPSQELVGFVGHGAGDELGFAIAPAGDVDGDDNEDLLVLARSDDIPAAGLDPLRYDAMSSCVRSDNPGAVLVFRGRGDGSVEAEPAYVVFGPEANQRIEAIAGAVDVNGDGLDDLVVGGREWDAAGVNAGGVAVYYGRAPAADGRVVAVCTPDLRVDGALLGVRLGAAVIGLGDLDQDGCEDFAAGAPEADPAGRSNAGQVHVYFGFAETGCASTSLRTAILDGADAEGQAGRALAGGIDVTGDGRPDLLVGAELFRDGRGEVGRVVLASGAYVVDHIDGTTALVQSSLRTPFVDGTGAGERLGRSIALALRPTGGAIAVLGGPLGDSAGRVDTGGAAVYALGADGFGELFLRVSGETLGESQLGGAVSAVRAGTRTYVAVGAPGSSLGGAAGVVDDGASYAFVLP